MAEAPPLSPVHSKLDLNTTLDLDSDDDESEADFGGPVKLGPCHYLIVLFCALVTAFVTTMMVYAFAS